MDDRNRYCRIKLQNAITLSTSQIQILSSHAKKQKPNESCALLLGHIQDDKAVVKDVILTDNVEKSPVNFTISPEQTLQGYQRAQKNNMEIVGIFHSHPDSEARPSSTDQKYMETNPYVWVIFSGLTNEFKAFVLESKIVEIPIA
ncbi:MAG: M67 family metallopeptidase [Thaumarchaeota archaeon]|nr:M67 family metallopeptidase [Nitrososphaerota archaeon]